MKPSPWRRPLSIPRGAAPSNLQFKDTRNPRPTWRGRVRRTRIPPSRRLSVAWYVTFGILAER
eukprot:3389757-Pyramimonas_sp.AAC.1